MRQPEEPGCPAVGEPALPEPELGTAQDPVGSDLAHLFDYCLALLGQDAEAARAARSVLDAADPLLRDPDRLRAALFESARTQALAVRPPSSDEPSYVPLALTALSGQQTDNSVLRALGALTDGDREILDLVYRHSIRPASLPAVLGVPAEETYRRLVNAEGDFLGLSAGSEACPGAGLEDIAALPLAALPAAEDERELPHRPARWSAGAALWRAVGRRRVQLSAAAVLPVAAIAGTVVYLAAAGPPAASPGTAIVPRSGASQASQRAVTQLAPHAGRSGQSSHSAAPGQPADVVVPAASPTSSPVPTPTSTPSPLPKSPKPKPSPP